MRRIFLLLLQRWLLKRGGAADADVRRTQCRLIRHRIADHRDDRAARLEKADLACLVRAREIGAHLADAQLLGRRVCETFRLTREEDEAEPALLERVQSASYLGAHIVADGDDAACVLA